MFLNAESFLNLAGKLKTSFITPKELGLAQGVWVRELTGSEREEVQKAGGTLKMNKDGSQEYDMSSMRKGTLAIIATYGMVMPKYPDSISYDDDGKPDAEAIEYEQMFAKNITPTLSQLSSQVLDVIAGRVRLISGLVKNDEKKD